MMRCWILRWKVLFPDMAIWNSIPRRKKISNHAFVDGNKRIGLYVMLSFLEMNGVPVRCTDDELVRIGISIAEGSMGYEELLQWVLDHRG